MSSRLKKALPFFVAAIHSALCPVALPAQNGSSLPGPYDFIPGERVLYAEDFQAILGSAAVMKRLNQATSRIAIDPREGRLFLHARPPASYIVPLKDTLPESFTIDFDMYIPGVQVLRITAPESNRQTAIDIGPHLAAVSGSNQPAVTASVDRMIANFDEMQTMHYSIAVNRQGIRIYVRDVRVIDAPGASFGKASKLKFDFVGRADSAVIDQNIPIWIAGIRIATGNPPMYEALSARGRVATHGIFFNLGSDRIRPESAPTLNMIGEMLTLHPDLMVRIEAHTDNFGDSRVNYMLSDERAQAVKEYLTAKLGINASRLSIAALGDTKPIAPNTTPEGREQNRRIELVRQ